MSKDYKKIARTVISTEIDGLRKLRKSINSSFNKAVELILKAKNALVTSSGTAAIHLAYLAIGLKKGNEIIVPGYGYLAAANMAKLLNLRIVFADVDPNSFCVTEKNIKKVITKKTKAIIITHTYGNMCEVDKINRLAKKRKIILKKVIKLHFTK